MQHHVTVSAGVASTAGRHAGDAAGHATSDGTAQAAGATASAVRRARQARPSAPELSSSCAPRSTRATRLPISRASTSSPAAVAGSAGALATPQRGPVAPAHFNDIERDRLDRAMGAGCCATRQTCTACSTAARRAVMSVNVKRAPVHKNPRWSTVAEMIELAGARAPDRTRVTKER